MKSNHHEKKKKQRTLSAEEKKERRINQTQLIEKCSALAKDRFYNDTDEKIITISQPVKPRVKTGCSSLFWTYFLNFVSPELKIYAVCSLCRQVALAGPIHGGTTNFAINVGKTGSTSKLSNHLRKYHCMEYEAIMKQKDGGNDQQQTTITSFINNRFNSTYHQALIEWIVKSGQPFSTVNCPHFQNFVKAVHPDLIKVNRNTLATKIADLAYLGKQRLKKILVDQHLCLTTDGWTSQSQGFHYIALTAHYVDSSWCVKSVVLACRHHSGSSTAEDHRELNLNIMNEFSIEKKCISYRNRYRKHNRFVWKLNWKRRQNFLVRLLRSSHSTCY